MTQNAYILIPGSLLPHDAAESVFSSLPQEARSRTASVFSRFELSSSGRFSPMPYARASHLMWTWRRITAEEGYPETAPAAWTALGCPPLNRQIWELSFLKSSTGGAYEVLGIDRHAFSRLYGTVNAAARKVGAKLQTASERFFLAFEDPIAAVSAPARALDDATLPEAAYGPEEERFSMILSELESNLLPAFNAASEKKACRLWLHGGGEEFRFKPSTIRAVSSDDEIVGAWAVMAGIPSICVSGADAWPQSPKGDRLFVFSELYEHWLKSDWKAWSEALPGVLERIEKTADKARGEDFDEVHVLLFGFESLAAYSPKSASLISKLFGRKELFEGNPFILREGTQR